MARELRRPEGCLSDFALDRRLAGEEDADERRAVEGHLASCARCADRLATLSTAREAFGRAAPPLVLPRRRGTAARWLWGGGVVAAAAAALLLVRPSNVATTRTKGGGEELGFYVKHGNAVRLGAAGDRVEPGDSLRFVYSSAEPRYLAVLSVDGTRQASVYYPGSPLAARVEPGVAVVLPVSTVLDETLGEETVYGVFCPGAFEVEPIRRALETHPSVAPALDGCHVESTRLTKETKVPP